MKPPKHAYPRSAYRRFLRRCRCGMNRVLRGRIRLSVEHPSRAPGQERLLAVIFAIDNSDTMGWWQWDATCLVSPRESVQVHMYIQTVEARWEVRICSIHHVRGDQTSTTNSSITWCPYIQVLSSAHYKPSISRSRVLDSALIQAFTPHVLIMACRIWFTHQQNSSSHSNLFLGAVQTSHLRPSFTKLC